MEVLVPLILLIAVLSLIGHGLWVLAAKLLHAIFGSPANRNRTGDASTLCARCLSPKPNEWDVCETCVASISSRPQQKTNVALTAIQNQIDRLQALGVLDSATYERLAQTIAAERLERTLPTDALRSAPDSASTIPESITTELDALPVAEAVEPPIAAQPDDVAERRDRSERIRELAAKFRTPTDKATTGSVAASSSMQTAADSAFQTEPSEPRVAISKLLASFMEEHSIRWGEIVGGMLIICCSIALVISFWSEIAARPLLKFFIFNSVTAGLFAVGFYTDRRWQLKTTSVGILIISILLVPLNVLAIAAFTDASPPSDLLSIAGEAISLIVFGGFTYFAARTVLPHNGLALVIGVMMPSIMQLLIRRFAHLESAYLSLYVLALAPVAGYWATSGAGLRWLDNEDEIGERACNELFILLGLVTYSVLLPLALFLYKIWQSPAVIHDMSPVLSLFAIPAVVVGVFSWRRLGAPVPATARIIGVTTGCLGLVLMTVAVFVAWPNPATLLPVTLIPGLLFLLLATWWKLTMAFYVTSLATMIAWPLIMNVLRGTIGWRSSTAELSSSMLSAPTGNLLIPLAGVMAAAAALLARQKRHDEARVIGISTIIVATICLTLVTWFGFGRTGDPFGVTWTFAAIAIGTYTAATWINHYGLTWAASAMILGAVAQGALFRWPVEGTWPVRCAMAALIHASICSVLLGVIAFAKRTSHQAQLASRQAALVTSFIASLLIVTVWLSDGATDVLPLAAWVTIIWLVLAIAANEPLLFAAFQTAFVVTLLCVTVRLSETYPWYSSGRLPWLQPQFLQCLGILLSGFTLVWSALRWRFPPNMAGLLARQNDRALSEEPHDGTRTFDVASANWSLDAFVRRLGGLIHDSRSCVDHCVALLIVALATWLALYASVPGVAQELAPRVQLDAASSRVVPPIHDFEIPNVPSLEASNLASWGLWALAIGVVLARSRQWTPGVSKLLLWFLLGLACPLASAQWAADVSVASALRWALAFFFLLASVPLWLRRRVPRWLAKFAVPQTSWRVGGIREVTATQCLLLATVLVPYSMMAVYVGTSAVSITGVPVPVAGILPALSLVAGFSVLISAGMWLASRQVSEQRQTESARSAWMSHAGNAIAFVGVGPILVAISFTVAAALVKHPIVGPEPGSWFGQVGWSVAYVVPVLLIAVTLVGHAVRERSAAFAFSAGILFQVAGFMLTLPRLGRTLDESAWINVAQINTIVAGLVSLAWLTYFTLLDRSKREPRSVPTLLTSYVLIAATLLLLTLLPSLGQLWLDPVPANWVTMVGGLQGWLAFCCVSIAMMWWGRATAGRFGILELGAAMLSAVIMAATTIAHWDKGNWLAYHTVELGTVVALVAVVTGWWEWLSRLVTPSVTPTEASGTSNSNTAYFTTDTLNWYAVFAMIGVIFALRGAMADNLANWWSVGTIAAVAFTSALLAWNTQRRGLVFVAGILWSLGGSVWWLLVQLPKYTAGNVDAPIDFLHFNQVLAVIPIAFSLVFRRVRIEPQERGSIGFSYHGVTAIIGILVFGLTAAVGLAADLTGDPLGNSTWLSLGAWSVLMTTAIGWHAERRSSVTALSMYIIGLLGVGLLQDRLNTTGSLFWWSATMLLAAYGLATSYLWSQREKMQGLFTPWRLAPATDPAQLARRPERFARAAGSTNEQDASRGSFGWLVLANGWLAAIVVLLVGWIDLTFETLALRVPASHAVLAQAFSLALLAKGTTRTSLQYASLSLGGVFAVVFGWSWLQPNMEATVLHHAVVVVVAIAAVAIVYGFGLVKFFKRRNDWVTAAEQLVPVLVAFGSVTLLFVSSCEVWHFLLDGRVPIQWAAIVAVSIALAGVCAACLAAALLPGRDPLGLSERGRQIYVYAAEFVLALLCMHIRITMPWLFHGWFTRFWPLIAMGIAFLGVGFGELLQRRRQQVLSDPLVTTGALLPVLPVLSLWVVPSEVNYALTLLSVGALYATLSALRKSFLYAVLATVAANGSLWYLLHQVEGLDFVRHPQFWLIPPALCTLVASHLCRRQLTDSQLTSIRYAAAIVIYAASTADIVINGVGDAPWLPLVLAAISLVGIFAGIMLRIRAFLYMGVSFLMVSLFTIIWYAAVELERTWIWWVSGIVTGILIIVLFAVFEKRRDDMLQLVENLKQWEP